MGFDQEQDRTKVAGKTTADKSATTTGKRTQVEDEKTDPDARLATLVKQLERQFVRNPAVAKATAVTLSVEFPERFDAAWVLRIYADIDAAVWGKDKVDAVLASWDDKPGYARALIDELQKRYRADKGLQRWAVAMERQITEHQTRLRLEGEIRAWDRKPGLAQAAARELNRLWPRNYPKRWLRQFEKQVWSFQDVKWAEKITSAELTSALGDNVIDWDEAPVEVKQELQIRLGREKAQLYYGKGGKGAKDTREVVLSDDKRADVLGKSAQVAPGFDFTKKEDIPVKRLELTAKQYDKKSDELLGSQIKTEQSSPNQLLAMQPDVFTTLYNNVIAKQAQEYRERGAQYRALKANIEAKRTSIAAERDKIKADIAGLDREIANQSYALTDAERQAKENPDAADKLEQQRKMMKQLEDHKAMLAKVLEDPDGVIPGAGQLALAFPPRAMQAGSMNDVNARRQVNQVIDAIEYVTGGENPTGIQRNFQEMAIGLVRFKGRFDMFAAGVARMVGNLGSYVLPDSMTTPIINMADQAKAVSIAFSNANTKYTKDNEASSMAYTADGGKLPMIDRVFSTQKIFEKPDVAILAFLQAMPTTKGVSLALQIGINGAQTLEAFFSTYGRTGQLTPSLQAAGWSAVQGTVGIVLDKLGLPPSAGLIANITLVFGFGKLRGLSREQIEEEIAYALVGAAVGAVKTTTRPGGSGTLEGVAAKTREIVSAIEESSGKTPKADETPTTELTGDDLVRSKKIDDAANELAATIETSRLVMRELQALQQQKQPTKTKVEELRKVAQQTTQKRAALKDALGATRTVGTTKITTTTTDATPTKIEVEATPTAKVEPDAVEPTTPKTEVELSTEPTVIDASKLQLTTSGAVGKNNAGVYTTTVDGVPAFVKVLKAADANEVAVTQRLGELGIGPRLLGTTTIDGLPAIITEAITDAVQIDRNTLMISPDAAAYASLTPEQRARIVADIERAAQVVETAGVEVGDLQFLFSRSTGKLYVIDPGQFYLLPAGKTAPLARAEVETFARNLKKHWANAKTAPTTLPETSSYKLATPGDRIARASVDLDVLLPTQRAVSRKKVEEKLADIDAQLENPKAIRVIETPDGKLHIWDGHHTVEAAKRAGKTTIEVQVFTVEQAERLSILPPLGQFQKLEVVDEFVNDN